MSTRGVVGLYANGRDWLMYNHSSSYPNELGQYITDAVRGLDLDRARAFAKTLVEVDEDDIPKVRQLRELWPRLGETEDIELELAKPRDHRRDFYGLYRRIQGELDTFIERGLRFWPHTLFALNASCEWGYVLNLEEDTLEYYTGHWSQTTSRYRPKLTPRGRFTRHPQLEEADHPLHLIESVPVQHLRRMPAWVCSQWLERLQRRF